MSGWELGGRGLAIAGRESCFTSVSYKKYLAHSGNKSFNQGLEVTSFLAVAKIDCLSSPLEAYLQSFLRHNKL